MRSFYVAAVSAFLTCLLAAACNLTTAGQAKVDQIDAELAAAQELRLEARAELEAARDRLAELEALIAGAAPDDPGLEGAEAEAAVLAQHVQELETALEGAKAEIEDLQTKRDETKAEDKGTQVAGWLELLGTLLGGGALGGVFSRLGPSRGRNEVQALREELAALKAGADAFAASPSRASGEVGRLAEKIARLEGLLAAFQTGLGDDEGPTQPDNPST